jgi:hypothetical protein
MDRATTKPETARGDPVWDLTREAPHLAQALRERGVEAGGHIRAFSDGIPLPPGIAPFEEGDRVRPYRHLRAYYQRLDHGVLAIKGTEPFAADLAENLDGMAAYRVTYPSRGRSLFSALEHFPIVEHKTPLAVPLSEALADAERAVAWQRTHLHYFGTLAHGPVPLLVARWPGEVVDAYAQTVLPMVSARARAIVETTLNGGLGCLVYHYPTVPLRAAHLDETLAGPPADYRSRRESLTKHGIDPEKTIDGWMEQAARMLAAGFLPGSIESIGIGHCLEAQNAVVDGGFVDLGSMQAMTDVEDPGIFAESVLAACADLAKTVRTFLLGALEDPVAEYRNPSLAMTAIAGRIFEDMRKRLSRLVQTVPMDPRLITLVEHTGPFTFLDQILDQLHPPSGTANDHA